jgi:hypothetical protein
MSSPLEQSFLKGFGKEQLLFSTSPQEREQKVMETGST